MPWPCGYHGTEWSFCQWYGRSGGACKYFVATFLSSEKTYRPRQSAKYCPMFLPALVLLVVHRCSSGVALHFVSTCLCCLHMAFPMIFQLIQMYHLSNLHALRNHLQPGFTRANKVQVRAGRAHSIPLQGLQHHDAHPAGPSAWDPHPF